MARYIDAEMLKRDYAWFGNGSEQYRHFKESFDRYVDAQPTADVVEVVRCKDCKYGHELIDENGYRFRLCNNHFGHGLMVEDHGFCKWGERRNDG